MTADSIRNSPSGESVALAHLPILMGIFQGYRDLAHQATDAYRSLYPSLKQDLKKHDIHDFDELIDQLTAKFEMIFDDEDLPERIKQQIGRLQIYLFISSFQERDLLKRSGNPARRLLDSIVRTEVDLALGVRQGRSGYDFLCKNVDRLSSSPFVESSVYLDLLEGYTAETASGDGDSSPPKSQEKTSADIQAIKPVTGNGQADAEAKKATRVKPESIVRAVVESIADTRSKPVEKSETSKKPEKIPETTTKPAVNSDNIFPVVQSIVNDMTLPLRVQGRSLILFDEVWTPLLLEVALTKGFKSPAWHKILTIAKTQVWVLTPKSTQPELDKLTNTIKQIEKSLGQGMQSLKLSIDQQASLLEFLEHEQSDIIAKSKAAIEALSKEKNDDGNKTKPSAKDASPGVATTTKVNLADTVDEFSDLMQTGRFKNNDDMLKALDSEKTGEMKIPVFADAGVTADRIDKGDWIEIRQGASTVLAKLTWKSNDESQFIFVDREGHRVCDISRDELDKQLKSGDITLISSSPGSSKRASFSVIQTIG